MSNEFAAIVQSQVEELARHYSGSTFVFDPEKSVVHAALRLSAQFREQSVGLDFAIDIVVPDKYPDVPPYAREVGGRIPREFHQFSDGRLCLAAPLDVHLKFAEKPTLYGYVEHLVVPYLYTFAYKQKFNEMPYGDLDHGAAGILQYYRELFAVSSDSQVLDLLSVVLRGDCRGHRACPCGSGRRLRDCHRRVLQRLINASEHYDFRADYRTCEDGVEEVARRIGRSLDG